MFDEQYFQILIGGKALTYNNHQLLYFSEPSDSNEWQWWTVNRCAFGMEFVPAYRNTINLQRKMLMPNGLVTRPLDGSAMIGKLWGSTNGSDLTSKIFYLIYQDGSKDSCVVGGHDGSFQTVPFDPDNPPGPYAEFKLNGIATIADQPRPLHYPKHHPLWEGTTPSDFNKPRFAPLFPTWRFALLSVQFPDAIVSDPKEADEALGKYDSQNEFKYVLDASQLLNQQSNLSFVSDFRKFWWLEQLAEQQDKKSDSVINKPNREHCVQLESNASDSWLMMSKPSTSYSYGEFSSHQAFIKEVYDLHMGLVKTPDLDPFDSVDVILIVVPKKCTHLSYSATLAYNPMGDGKLSRFRCITMGSDIYGNKGGYRTVVHEIGHVLGLPDLYPQGANGAMNSIAGPWNIMSDSHRAMGFCGWHRYKLGWLGADRIQVLHPYQDAVNEQEYHCKLANPVSRYGTVTVVVARDQSHDAQGNPVSASYIVIERLTPTQGVNSGKRSEDGVVAYSVNADTTKPPINLLYVRSDGDTPDEIKQREDFGNLHKSFAPFNSEVSFGANTDGRAVGDGPLVDSTVTLTVGDIGDQMAELPVTIKIARV